MSQGPVREWLETAPTVGAGLLGNGRPSGSGTERLRRRLADGAEALVKAGRSVTMASISSVDVASARSRSRTS